MKNNEKGIALVTTLVLGLVALVFISAFLYVLLNSTKTSGLLKTYTNALEVAKGTASHLMLLSLNGALKCSDSSSGSPCQDCLDNGNCNLCQQDYENCPLDVSDLQKNISNFEIKAYLLTKEDISTPSQDRYIYTFKVKTKKVNSNDKAEIDFVYKIGEE